MSEPEIIQEQPEAAPGFSVHLTNFDGHLGDIHLVACDELKKQVKWALEIGEMNGESRRLRLILDYLGLAHARKVLESSLSR